MNKISTSHSSNFKKNYYLNPKKNFINFSNSPISSRINKLKKSYNYEVQKSYTNKLRKSVNFKENLFENVEKERTKIKRMLSDLNSWDDKNNLTDYHNKKNFDLKNIRVPTIGKNKIISPELIPFIKFRENARNEANDMLLKNEKKLEFIKYTFSVFDKDFSKSKFEEKINLKLNDIENANKIIESIKDKRFRKLKLLNEIKSKDTLIVIHKKLIMNKLKKKKFFDLINETYDLLEKAKIDTSIIIDKLNARIKSAQKFYAAFIDLFKGTSIKILEDNLRILEQLSINNDDKKDKDTEKESEESIESEEESEKKSKIKNEIDISRKMLKRKNRLKFKEKIKMYLEYVSIHNDIQNEINKYEERFNFMQKELDIIITNIKNKLEEINKDSLRLKVIQKKMSQKQIKYYLKILKKGEDIRFHGLSWILIRLIELNVPIESSIFPEFLNREQIDYLLQIAKYGYEINQLKIILDALREKETGKKNSNLNIFSRISQGLLNTNFYNNSEGNKSNYHVCYSNNLTTDKVLLKMMKKNPLSPNIHKFIKEDQYKFQIEKNFIDLKAKKLKKRISMYALGKQFKLNNDEKNNNDNINELIILSSDKKSKYFYDILRVIEKINNLNNLLNERREQELKSFCEKFKYKNMKDETTKNEFNMVFNALFGNSGFH